MRTASTVSASGLGLVVGFLLLAVLVSGCDELTMSEEAAYENEILQHRLERDMRMRDADRTILDASTRRQFEGLRYYAVDPEYRFELPLEEVDTPDTLEVAQYEGRPVDRIIVGYVSIPQAQDTTRLAAFREPGREGELWVPFRDPTNGDETYGAGRYLNAPLVNDSTLVIDFNKAYNPYCDYNLNYVCPLPPPENTLPEPVEVGEKKSLLHS